MTSREQRRAAQAAAEPVADQGAADALVTRLIHAGQTRYIAASQVREILVLAQQKYQSARGDVLDSHGEPNGQTWHLKLAAYGGVGELRVTGSPLCSDCGLPEDEHTAEAIAAWETEMPPVGDRYF